MSLGYSTDSADIRAEVRRLRLGPSGGRKRCLQLFAGADEQDVDKIRGAVGFGGVRSGGRVDDQCGHSRALLTAQALAGGRRLGWSPRGDGRGQAQRELDAGGVVKLRLRHLHQQRLDGPDRDLRVNLPLQSGSNVAAGSIGQAAGGADTPNAAVPVDPLAAVVDLLHPRRKGQADTIRRSDARELQIERRVFVNESESHALYRLY